MKLIDLSIKNCKIVSPSGIISGGVAIEGGKIVAVVKENNLPKADKVIDAGGNYLIPGVVDPHSHLSAKKTNDMKREYGETIKTETASAAAGGVTTLFSTTTWFSIEETAKIIDQNSMIDMAFHKGVRNDQHLKEIPKSVNLGVTSFKSLLIGYPKYGVFPVDDGLIYAALKAVRDLGYPAIELVHCENLPIINRIQKRLIEEGRTDFLAWYDSRPSFCEEEAMRRVMFLAETLNAPLYIPHMTIKEGVRLVAEQKAKGLTVIAESCPHHLTLTKHEKKGWLAKVTPPLRDKEDIDALWKGIRDGIIECVGSDHVPLTVKDKKLGTDIWDIHGAGFPGTETLLPIMLSEGVNKGRISFERLVEVCCHNPAKVFGIFPKKGVIQVGSDADLVIVDLNKEVKVTPEILHSASDFTIYEGWRLKGWPIMTIFRGNVVMEDGDVVDKPRFGKYLHRKLLKKANT